MTTKDGLLYHAQPAEIKIVDVDGRFEPGYERVERLRFGPA